MLITFSGIDGAGKSTQIHKLQDYLTNEGVPVRLLTFWDDVAVFRWLRSGFSRTILQSDGSAGTAQRSVERKDKNRQAWPLLLGRSLLYLLDVFHLRRIVEMARTKNGGGVIIFDRYIYDQLAALPIRHWLARRYARFVLSLTPRPDICYLLDADPEAARARKPEYPLEFLRIYRDSFLELTKLTRLQLIPPADPDRVHAAIVIRLEECFSDSRQRPVNPAVIA